MKEIYLDNAATSKTDFRVIEKMMAAFSKNYGNPSSLHRLGMKAEQAVNEVRETIAKTLNCDGQEIYFTSGGTEGNNMIIQGIVENKHQEKIRVITTAIEHPSVLDVFTFYQKHHVEVIILDVDLQGKINLQDLKESLDENTLLVSIIGVNNELGTIQDLAAIGKMIKEKNKKCVFHTDFVQGYVKIPVDVKECQIDALTLCAHKIFGPKGVGAVYIKKGIAFKPLLRGGGQEKNKRSGTENVPGIIGLGEAVRLRKDSFKEEAVAVKKLRDHFIREILKKTEDVKINGSPEGSPYLLNISFDRVRGEVLLHSLEEQGIYVSTGSACASHKKEKQYVLKAIGLAEEYKEGTIRISFSNEICLEEIEEAVNKTAEIVKKLRLLTKVKQRK